MRIFTAKSIISAMLASVPAIACAWGSLDSPASVYSLLNSEIGSMKSARTADGKTYISWLQWSEVGEGMTGYDVHMQLLDENGSPMWGEKGLVVETRLNASWTAAYSLVVTPDGSAVVSWADARSAEGTDMETSSIHEPVLYKISQNQEFLWGTDGITFGPEYKYPPTLYMIGGNLYATILSSDDYGPSAIVRINEDGSFAFEPKEFFGTLAPSEGTDFISIYAGSKGTEAMRYNSDVEPVWSESAVVSEYLYSGYARDPYRVASDGNGGIVVSFARALDFTHLPLVQHISADGEATFGSSVDVIPEENMLGDYDYPIVGINPDTETILSVCNNYGGGNCNVLGQEFDLFGERLWGDTGKNLVSKESLSGYSYGPIMLAPISESEWFVVYADETGWAQSELHFACFDNEGRTVWDYASEGPLSITDPSFDFSDNVFTFLYTSSEYDDDWNETYSINTIRYEITATGINQISDNVKNGVKEYYSVNGVRLERPAKGLNIVRYEDGTTEKIMVK